MKADRRIGTLAENAEHALSWVNAFRTEWGLEPLRHLRQGCPSVSNGCALAESLFYGGGMPAHFGNNGTVEIYGFGEHQMPAKVATFEHDFERQFYPDLVKPGAAPPSWYAEAVPRPSAVDSPAQMA